MAEKIHPATASPSVPILHENKHFNGASDDPEHAVGSRSHHSRSQAPLPPPHYRRKRGCCCFLFIWTISIIATVIFLLGLAALILWLVVRPIHLPKYTVDQVSLSSVAVNTNGVQPTISASITYTVRANNPNKHIGIHYDSILVLANYRDSGGEEVRVGVGQLPGFYQGHRNLTILNGSVDATNLAVSQAMAQSLQNDLAAQSVPLTIVVRVKARVKARSLTLPRIRVRNTCRIHVSPANAPGGARLLDRKCKLKVGI